MLKAWGAPEVWVQSDQEQDGEGQFEHEVEMKAVLEKRLREKFSDVIEDPVMTEIMRVAGEHLLKRYVRRKAQ